MESAEKRRPLGAAVDAMALQDQQELVLRYAPLVRSIARNLPLEIPGILEYDDAVGFGMCGLVEAVQRYDPDKGANFHAYAARRIRGSMIDAFRRLDRLSRTTRQRSRELQLAEAELQSSLGRVPTEAETAARLGLPLEEFRKIAANGRWVTVSLDRLIGGDEGEGSSPRAEMPLADEDIDFTRGFEEQEVIRALAESVRRLPARERTIISLYYVEQLTMKDIGAILNVSETRVSQLHGQALRRLRGAMLAAEAA